MALAKNSAISIRVNKKQKEELKLLSIIKNRTMTELFCEFIEREVKSHRISIRDLKKLPKEKRQELIKSMNKKAMPIYLKYKDELEVEEISDGIE
ncbi:hypothetical protein ACFLSQ_08435 [Bacteroidota bacterium]